jgi:hypothetical protein
MAIDKEMQEELTRQTQAAEAAAGKAPGEGENDDPPVDRGDDTAAAPGDDTGAPADDAAKDAAKDADKDDDAGAPGIPRSRFHAINERRKEAEAKAANLEAQLAAYERQGVAAAQQDDSPLTPDPSEVLLKQQLEAATREYAEAVSVGNGDAAVAAQDKITDAQANLILAKAPKIEAGLDMADAVEEVNYNNAIAEMKTKYPQLDEESQHYDETAVIEVNKLFQGLATVEAKSVALKQAVGYVFPNVVDRKPGRKDTDKNIQDAQNAAPDLANKGEVGAGDPYKGVNISTLPEEDFEKLPDSKKQELRGDFL